jgi:two-component sensor histidine kinase/CHASE3 domain sensor protein
MSEATDSRLDTRNRERHIGRRLAMISSLCLMVLAGVAAVILVQGVNQQLLDVIDTYEVRRQARELSISLVEAESAQRGYLLTGNEEYLAPFQRATTAVERQLEALLGITRNNADQTQRLESIVAEVYAAIEQMRESVTDLSSETNTQVRVAIGTRLMDELRETLNQFVAEEDLNLIQRNTAIESMRLGLTVAILVALVGAAVLTYTLIAGSQRQVTALSKRQSDLISEKEVLEAAVRERTAALEEARAHADRERERVETLLQDTNHRIGNSLATVSSLLGLQVMRARSEDARSALEAARDRVQAIASGHRRLRLGADMETTRIDEFLASVMEDLSGTQGGSTKAGLEGDFDPLVVSSRDATTLGIILGELVTNALKHAFPDGGSGTVWVRFERDGEGVPVLVVEDDGRGIRDGDVENADGGLGSVIIAQLAGQFGGEVSHHQREGGGTSARVRLPELEVATVL